MAGEGSEGGGGASSRESLRTWLNLLGVALDTMDGIESGQHPLDALHGAWKAKGKNALTVTVRAEEAEPRKGRQKGQCLHGVSKRICPQCWKDVKPPKAR